MRLPVLKLVLMWFASSCTAGFGIEPSPDDSSIDSTAPGGGGQSTNPENSILPCNALSWCTSFRSNPTEYQVDGELGGVITDGVYRLERGSAFADALIFEGDRFLRVFNNSSNTGGSFQTTSDNMIRFFHDTDCNENVGDRQLGDAGYSTESLYRATGDTIEFDSGCTGGGPNPVMCSSDKIYRRVNDLCDPSGDFSCDEGGCPCRTREDVSFSSAGSSESCDL